jgi:tetratricopeptide (TPR) repeat protein
MSFYEIETPLIAKHNVGKALRAMKETIAEDKLPGYIVARYEDVKNDYRLMQDAMMRGLRDDKIDEVYADIMRKVYGAGLDVFIEEKVKKYSSFAYARVSAQQTEAHPDAVRTVLEAYVQDMAMMAFEPENTRKAKMEKLTADHHAYMKQIFNALLVAPMWNDRRAADFADLLLSPTIDRDDALLLVSAVMLATMNVNDPYKWDMLAEVYVRATDKVLKMRALVGWVLSLPYDPRGPRLFPFVQERIKAMLADKTTLKQMLDMQMQMLFCCNADADNEEIQRNIMPTLIKNTNLQMTRLGIVEKEDDPMKDIMDPNAAERDMEEMERKYRKMMDMQKQGSDIYFGGFSKMKTFPFFNDLCNWFAPFNAAHPALGAARERLAGSTFLNNLMENGPFCDSDKYSFALAIAQIMDRMPDNVKEMLNSDATLGPTVSKEEQENPAYICRSYLQSLYRFFRLYRSKRDFLNPFILDELEDNDGNALFMSYKLLACPEMEENAVALCGFLLKRKMMRELVSMAICYKSSQNPRLVRFLALVPMTDGKWQEAYDLFASVSEDQHTEESLRGMAHCCMSLKRFGEAVAIYRRLLAMHPDSFSYQLNLAVCLMSSDAFSSCGDAASSCGDASSSCDDASSSCGDDASSCDASSSLGGKVEARPNKVVEEGTKLLYKLDYEHPNNANVRRVLAWCMMLQGNFDKAIDIYTRLLSQPDAVSADRLNAAYAHWLSRNVARAVALLREYCNLCEQEEAEAKEAAKKQGRRCEPTKSRNFRLVEDFTKDADLLSKYGISLTERKIMVDIVLNEEEF